MLPLSPHPPRSFIHPQLCDCIMGCALSVLSVLTFKKINMLFLHSSFIQNVHFTCSKNAEDSESEMEVKNWGELWVLSSTPPPPPSPYCNSPPDICCLLVPELPSLPPPPASTSVPSTVSCPQDISCVLLLLCFDRQVIDPVSDPTVAAEAEATCQLSRLRQVLLVDGMPTGWCVKENNTQLILCVCM